MNVRIPPQLRVLLLWAAALFGSSATVWPAEAPVLGDLNGDGVVNVQDLALLVNHLQAVRFLGTACLAVLLAHSGYRQRLADQVTGTKPPIERAVRVLEHDLESPT